MTQTANVEHELTQGNQQVRVSEVGATLRSYRVGPWELLDQQAPGETQEGGRGHVLLPWPNRIEDGMYVFEGDTHKLEITDTAHHNAIHGLTRRRPWKVEEKAAHQITLGIELDKAPGYPFRLGLRVTYALESSGLTVTLRAVNQGAEPLPFGGGFHPYFNLGPATIDGVELTLPAKTFLKTNQRLIPIGRSAVVGTALDFREECPIDHTVFNHCFTELRRDAHGIARVGLRSPERGAVVTVWMDAGFEYVQIYSGEQLDPSARRRALAIEPMTCAPNAFRSGDGLKILSPQQRFEGKWGISARR